MGGGDVNGSNGLRSHGSFPGSIGSGGYGGPYLGMMDGPSNGSGGSIGMNSGGGMGGSLGGLQQQLLLNGAIEQYTLALAQFNSAQSQMAAASALLQSSGILLPSPHPSTLAGGMQPSLPVLMMPLNTEGIGPMQHHHMHGGQVSARRELF